MLKKTFLEYVENVGSFMAGAFMVSVFSALAGLWWMPLSVVAGFAGSIGLSAGLDAFDAWRDQQKREGEA